MDIYKTIGLLKLRSYRFFDELQLHIVFEELENKIINNVELKEETISFVKEFMSDWDKGLKKTIDINKLNRIGEIEGIDLNKERIKRDESPKDSSSSRVQKVVFIVGSPRSGTSFLYYLMCYSKQFAFFNSLTHPKWTAYNFSTNKRKFFNNFSEDILNLDTKEVRLLSNAIIPSEGEEILNRSIKVYDHIQKHTYLMHKSDVINKELLVNSINEHCALFRTPYFLCKSPFNSFRINELNEIFEGNCYFIHIHRDGYNVSQSMRANNFYYYFDSIEQPLLHEEQWGRFIEEINNYKDKNMLTIKYEDVRKDTYAYLKKIYDFIDIKTDIPNIKLKPQIAERVNTKGVIDVVEHYNQLLSNF